MKRLILCSLAILTTLMSFAQGHDIKLKVKGMENKDVILAYHYGDKQYVTDTFTFNSKGFVNISGTEPLTPGIYMAVFPSIGNKYFEFIINEQSFSLETESPQFVEKMKVTNSKENELFYADMRFLSDRRKESTQLRNVRNRLKEAEKTDSLEIVNKRLGEIDEAVLENRKGIMKDHKGTFYANLLELMQDVEFPEKIADSVKYNYYINHYWDGVDFGQRGIIRTPVYLDKLSTYHTKILPQIPDTLKVYFDQLLEKSLKDSFVFQYTIVHLLNHYAKSKIMGMDAVYVHLVNEYYTDSTKVWWPDYAQRFKIVDEAKRLSPLLLGQTAPNMILADTSLRKYYNLHEMPNKYKIVYIWDPDCGHCKKETPKLEKELKRFAEDSIDVAAYGVSTSTYEEMDKWKNFINEHKLSFINVADPYFQSKPTFRSLYDINSTPTIFLLDENNVIIGKRLSVEQIADFVRRKEGLIKGDVGPIRTTDPDHGSNDQGGDSSLTPK